MRVVQATSRAAVVVVFFANQVDSYSISRYPLVPKIHVINAYNKRGDTPSSAVSALRIASANSLHMRPCNAECDRPTLHQPFSRVNKRGWTNYSVALGMSSHGDESSRSKKRKKIREKVRKFAQTISTKSSSSPRPDKIAAVIKDATYGAAEIAVEEVIEPAKKIVRDRAISALPSAATDLERNAALEAETASALDSIALAKTATADAFAAADIAIKNAETALLGAKDALAEAKLEAAGAIAEAEEAAARAASNARRSTQFATNAAVAAVEVADEAASVADEVADMAVPVRGIEVEMSPQVSMDDISQLSYDDVGYHLSEMAPPFIGEDQCLVPGEAVVRVEKAPENSRRIFAGIDIMTSVDKVWNVLTDYEHLQNVVPNLVINDVVEMYDGDKNGSKMFVDTALPDEAQCEVLSKRMKGAKLKQVGGAKVVGINFSARTTLEVREWPEGLPDFAHFDDEVFEGKSRDKRARDGKRKKLKRYRFPRPFALSKLPTKDISMQSVKDDDGEFRLYQGVWRMQPLAGCAPPGQDAMRLTYAVEISPRAYLPVSLVEGRIAQDLCTNLMAIRNFVTPDDTD